MPVVLVHIVQVVQIVILQTKQLATAIVFQPLQFLQQLSKSRAVADGTRT